MFKEIKTILPRSVKRAGISSQVGSAKALKIISAIIKDTFNGDVAKKIKPLYVKDSIITVASLSPVVVKLVQKEETRIIKEINKNISGLNIRKIRYLL